MRFATRFVSVLALAFFSAVQARPQEAAPAAASNLPVVVIDTSKGQIKVELFPEQAPESVKNFLQYVDDSFYDDTIFHRVIPGMLIQGGGFTPEIEEKPTRDPIALEADRGLANVRGAIAMARTMERDSARAQFYINVEDNPEFDRSGRGFGYAVFGRVIDGLAVVDTIARVQTSRRGPFDDIPILPVFINSIRRAETTAEPTGTSRR